MAPYAIFDITLTLEKGMLTYPKDVPYQRTLQRSISQGATSNVSVVEMSAHTGTHIDAPRHYLNDGAAVDTLPLEVLYGQAFVIDCAGVPAVTAKLLAERIPPAAQRILLKTDNSRNLQPPFRRDFVYLDGSGARLLADRGVKLVAIDYLSIDKAGTASKPSHFTLLESQIVIIEGVNLAQVPPGEYFLACGPLKMADADGAPCRAVLISGLKIE